MEIDEAIKLLKENLITDTTREIYDDEIEAMETLIRGLHYLEKEVIHLAIDSVKREKELAKLEAQVIYLNEKFGGKI